MKRGDFGPDHSLSHSLSLSLTLSLSLSHSLYIYLYIFIYISVCLFISLSLSIYIFISLSYSISLPPSIHTPPPPPPLAPSSCRCVLEEDYNMREKVLTAKGARSLDNEAAQIAHAMQGYGVSFTAIQFSTDYIRRLEERRMDVAWDLANNRGKEAEAKRRTIMTRIFTAVERFLEGGAVAARL